LSISLKKLLYKCLFIYFRNQAKIVKIRKEIISKVFLLLLQTVNLSTLFVFFR
jgi:hypothetical protein